MRTLIAVFTITLCSTLTAQKDPILFSVDDMQVPVSEFEYIYNKNNRDNADYSQESVMEYLDLYTKFKLKVKRAQELQIDTIQALKTELEGYRKQLAKSYLNDKEVVDKLTREAFERMQYDVHLSHILVKIASDASQSDIDKALTRIRAVRERVTGGEDFGKLAADVSEDENTASNGGELGYVSAMLPNGFYAMETAAYDLKPGEISTPVRTTLGYHIIKLIDKRTAKGQVEAAHILMRFNKNKTNVEDVKRKIENVHEQLQKGRTFEELAKSVSDDKRSAQRNGYIGKFGINSFDPDFEEVAFALKDGEYSAPVKTRIGWHIIKKIAAVPPPSYEDERRKLEARIARDERMEIARTAMVDRIRDDSELTTEREALSRFVQSLGDNFLQFQWQVPIKSGETLLRFKDNSVKTTYDFAVFLKEHARERMRASKSRSKEDVAYELFEKYINEELLAYEERNLEQKYPDFKALMREYQEGILLFEVTKSNVWDRASQDTTGLREFFSTRRDNYFWEQRAEVLRYTISGANAKLLAKFAKWSKKLPSPKLIAKTSKKGAEVKIERKKYLAEDAAKAGIEWQKGWSNSKPVLGTDPAQTEFTIVENILQKQPKELNEARGYIIADYQDQLEKEWIDQLRQRYHVFIDKDVLKSLIKS